MKLPSWNAQGFLQQRVSPTGLALFRICYSLVLLWEVAVFWHYRHLIFDPVPYLQEGESYLQVLLPCWLAVVALLVLGCFTRTASILNYICSAIVFGGLTDYEYHYDQVCLVINFLLLFTPVSAVWSIDAWRKKRRGLMTNAMAEVHPIYYYALMLSGLGLVYFDAFFWKIVQPTWQQGNGVWRPMSLPPFTWHPTADFQFLLNQRWFMLLGNHLTLFLEAAFLFLMWSRRCRFWILLPLGFTLHLGIIVAFPLPKFALGMLTLYILLVPPDLWDRLRVRLAAFSQQTVTKSSGENIAGSGLAPASIWNHRYAIYGVLSLLLGMSFFQGLIILQDHQQIVACWLKPAQRAFLHRYTGLCMHGVFIDSHWNEYDHVVALVHDRQDGTFEWLPLTTPTGQMGSLATDRLWANWAFRANCASITNPPVENGVKRLTAYWLGSQGQPLDKAKFLVAAALHRLARK